MIHFDEINHPEIEWDGDHSFGVGWE